MQSCTSLLLFVVDLLRWLYGEPSADEVIGELYNSGVSSVWDWNTNTVFADTGIWHLANPLNHSILWVGLSIICNFIQWNSFTCTCTTTELSILLTSCLTAIKNHVIKYCTTVYERNGKKLFWSIKNSGEILNKLKSRGFLASGLSTYDFSTLYTTLPHNLIKEKLT